VLNPTVKSFLEPLGSLEEHIILLLVLRKIIPLVTFGICSSKKIERAVSLRVVMMKTH
jgi:hypothetical protein